MNPRQFALIVVSMILAGFLGAALSSGIWNVFAQNAPKRVTAQSFVVIDESGRKRGELGVSLKGPATLTLYDEHGNIAWSAPTVTRIQPAEIR